MGKFAKVFALIMVMALMLNFVACSSAKSSSPTDVSSAPKQQPNQSSNAENTSTNVNLKELKFSISDVPAKTMLIELIKAMQEQYKDVTFSYEVYPAGRALNNVKSGTSDVMFPYIQNPNIKPEGMILSTEILWKSPWVLYTNKSNKDINPQNVSNYKLEVHTGHTAYFNNSPESEPDGGLKKVDSGRIDGYITAMPIGDGLLKKLNLKNIKRTEFILFDTVAVFQDSATRC